MVSENRVVLFLIAGGLAAAANIGSRIFLSVVFPFEIAVVLAYLVGMTMAFFLMRGTVFDASRGKPTHQALRFAAVNLVAVLQTFLISVALARWALPALGMQDGVEATAHAVGIAIPVITSYFGHKYFSFR
jgi:putative flippase GtrA